MCLKREIEEALTSKVESQGFDKVDRIRVADIQFSYPNKDMIEILKKRGEAIFRNEWTKYVMFNKALDEVKNH
jgi:hypothetical protein